jgi:hypothetical protein
MTRLELAVAIYLQRTNAAELHGSLCTAANIIKGLPKDLGMDWHYPRFADCLEHAEELLELEAKTPSPSSQGNPQ